MKKILILLILILFFGCKDNQNKNQNIIKSENKIDTQNLVNIYPFNKAEKIEVISYPVRNSWDKNFSFSAKNIVSNKKLIIDSSYFKERIVISKQQAEIFFKPLIFDKCKEEVGVACYDPRHLFLFYNKEGKIFEYYEICFDCLRAYSTGKFPATNICYGSEEMYKNNLRKIGIKYFGDEKEENELYEKQLK